MRSVLFYDLLLFLIVLSCMFGNIQNSYHRRVGIPLAAEIKAFEQKQSTEGVDVFNRIAGGWQADIRDYPFLAGLLINLSGTTNQSVCGSTLLSANRLVTAGHCGNDGEHKGWRYLVILGSNNFYTGGVRIPATHIIPHPNYNHTILENDIAVIYLPTNVQYGESIQPISLPDVSLLNNNFVGQWAMAAGFGSNELNVSHSSTLNQVKVKVITLEKCLATYKAVLLRSSTLCTDGTGGVGICIGDSGGPLVTEHNGKLILIGISSYVDVNGCQIGSPSVFTRVTSYYHFITNNL